MAKKIVKLNASGLKRMIAESVRDFATWGKYTPEQWKREKEKKEQQQKIFDAAAEIIYEKWYKLHHKEYSNDEEYERDIDIILEVLEDAVKSFKFSDVRTIEKDARKLANVVIIYCEDKLLSQEYPEELNEGEIPDSNILGAIKKYVKQGDLETVLRTHPELVNVISEWLLENGEDDFIEMICHNFMDPREFA